MGENLDQAAIDALLAGANSAVQEKQESKSSGNLNQDDIDALFKAPAEEEVLQKEATSSESVNQAEIDALLNQSQGSDQSMNQDGIDTLLQGEISQVSEQASPAEGTPSISSQMMTQEEVDAMMAHQSTRESAPEPPKPMDQAEIDALLNQANSSVSTEQQMADAVWEEGQKESDSGHMNQAEIDALLNSQSGVATPTTNTSSSSCSGFLTQAEVDAMMNPAPGEQMNQAEIDALLQQSSTSASAPEVAEPCLNQDELNYLLSSSAPVPVEQKELEQLPNSLDAPTLAARQIKRVIKARSMRRRAQLFGGVYYLPERIEKRDLVSKAIQKLFDRARDFREKSDVKDQGRVCFIKDKYGHKVTVLLTKDQNKPIQLRLEAVSMYDRNRKRRNIQQVVKVDSFESYTNTTASRWVNWFDNQFDVDNLKHLCQCV
ncbi:MAG: hypothetical protein CSA81_02875 [Acidobacteria bacterium]|nr:MAG: hypothetical protein CSA81_02875 [Acidobacteriota bacterium]